MRFLLPIIASLVLCDSSVAQPPAPQTQQAEISTEAAEQQFQSGKIEEARDAFEAILKAHPDDTAAQRGEVSSSERLALDSRQAGHSDDALKALLRAQTFAPNDQRLLYDLGVLEDEMHLYRDADRTLTALEQLHPSDPQTLYAMARVKLDLGQLTPAEEKMKAYLVLQPNDASAHYGLGRVYQLGLQYDKAQAEFQRAIELQPLQTASYYELGDIALGQGAFDDAIANFNKTLARDPKHAGALAGIGEAYFKQKKFAEATEYLNRAIAAAPNYPAGHYYLGLTLARTGHKEDSQRELELATKLADEQHKSETSGLHLLSNPANP
jgi:tetratricopeptide (TPR) repeat protein